jgi:hypothetical protein
VSYVKDLQKVTKLYNNTDGVLSWLHRFEIPELRVGTLDSLMVLSDDLVKVNALVESVVNKIRRQLFEMTGKCLPALVCPTSSRSHSTSAYPPPLTHRHMNHHH